MEGMIQALVTATRTACAQMTTLHLRALQDSAERASYILGKSEWDCKAAAHAEIFSPLAAIVDDPALALVLRSAAGSAHELMLAGEVGAVAVRAGGGQLPADRDGFLGDRQGPGRAAQLPEPDAEVVQRCGEVGAVAVRAGGGQRPENGDGFLGDRQGPGRAAQLPEPDAEVVQRCGEVGAVAIRAGGRPAPGERR